MAAWRGARSAVDLRTMRRGYGADPAPFIAGAEAGRWAGTHAVKQ